MDITVVGAGVIGLSCAIALRERGHDVRIVARERTPRTTSDVAAAVWFPYHAGPPARVLAWARATRARLEGIAEDPESGVVMCDIIEPVTSTTGAPWWALMVDAWRAARPAEIPECYQKAWILRGPVIEMPRYMRWLEARAPPIELRDIRDLAEVDGDLVVNATGLGARDLAHDTSVIPVRGQVVRIRNPGLTRAILDESTPRALAYTIPRADGVICGGTADEGSWDTTPDPRVEAQILWKARQMEPALADCEVLSRAVGLRPARPEVRLEREGRIVHCYGHGGSGVTLSWGCAADVARLADPTRRAG